MSQQELIDRALYWARKQLGCQEGQGLRFSLEGSGNRSLCLAARRSSAGEAEALIVKVLFRGADRSEQIIDEFRALSALYEAAVHCEQGPFTSSAPRPIAVSTDPPAILMSRLEGDSLDTWLRSARPDDTLSEAAAALVRLLLAFYRRSPEPHGDLHFSNVLVSDRTIGLLDPGLTHPLVREQHVKATSRPIAVDMAVLLASVGFTSSRRYLKESGLFRRRARFARHALSAAAALSSADESARVVQDANLFSRERIGSLKGPPTPQKIIVWLGQRAGIALAGRA